jgi:hypothetical protein
MEVNEGNSLDKVYHKEQVSESVVTKIAALMLEAKLPSAITDVGKWITCSSSFESLSP